MMFYMCAMGMFGACEIAQLSRGAFYELYFSQLVTIYVHTRYHVYGSRPLKSTGRHDHFLNSIGQYGA